MCVFSWNNIRAQTRTQDRQFSFQRAPIDKFEQPQTFIVGNRQHRAQRRLNSFSEQRTFGFRIRRRFAENAFERVPKSTLRSISTSVPRFINTRAALHFAQGQSHSSRAMISLERHSVMALEVAARR